MIKESSTGLPNGDLDRISHHLPTLSNCPSPRNAMAFAFDDNARCLGDERSHRRIEFKEMSGLAELL